MQANISLILNVLLLIGVMVAIAWVVKTRRLRVIPEDDEPLAVHENPDDIIAVRKIHRELGEEQDVGQPMIRYRSPSNKQPIISPVNKMHSEKRPSIGGNQPEALPSVMMFLLAKENRQLAGYELLQTVLAAGMRFGEGQLFHRHQFSNGQGPVLCSLAAATPTGVFDLQNIGAFSAHGLCLFMQISGNSTIDAERFAIMLDTAKQLSEGIDTYLLDDRRQPLSDAGLKRYYRMLNIEEGSEQPEFA